MKKAILKMLLIVALIPALTFLNSVDAFARDGHGRGGRGGHWDRGGDHWRGHYSYRDGRWHNSGWLSGWFWTGLAFGTVVGTLPPYYETVYVGSVPYYYYDGIYYRQAPGGYIVVQEPPAATIVTTPPPAAVAATPPPVESTGTVVINVPNSQGGYTPVTLTKYKNGYLGPQGEYYEGNLTIEQLKALYGK